jgi:hypothetical protein
MWAWDRPPSAVEPSLPPGCSSFVTIRAESGPPEDEAVEPVVEEGGVPAETLPTGVAEEYTSETAPERLGRTGLVASEGAASRTARALWPVDRWENPAARIARGEAPAQTELEVNGQLITDSIGLNTAIPDPGIVGRPTPDGQFECRVERSIDITCRNRRIMPWNHRNGSWWARMDVAVLQGAGVAQCAGVAAHRGVQFRLTARPSADALVRRIIRSEYEHVMDTFAAFRQHLVPLHDRYAFHARNVTRGPDAPTCAAAILTNIDRNAAINAFVLDYTARQQARDGPGGDHSTDAPIRVDARCTRVTAVAQVSR